MFRPGFIEPLAGERPRSRVYSALYTVMRPLFPVLRNLGPGLATTTERLGRAMLKVARDGHTTRVVESRDINTLGA